MLWLSSDNTLNAFRSIFGTHFKFMRRASFYNAALAYVEESNRALLTPNRAGFGVVVGGVSWRMPSDFCV